ncbi:MAG: MBL fold metallo-hydrolase [Candidatus Hodarchaeota archaeon]
MQVTKRIHALRIPFQVTSPLGVSVERFVYVYLVHGKRVCLIDTGVASSEHVIFEYLRKMGRKPDEISMTVLTHSHPDHIGAAPAVKRTSGCSFAAHAGEKAWIEDVGLQARERPVPDFDSLVEGPVDIDHVLQEGDILDLGGGVTLEVLHTPGHSKGSISLWLQEDQALFTADAVPIPGDMPIYEDVVASVESIKKLRGLSKVEVLLASWDEPRKKEQAHKTMEQALTHLQRIHQAVIELTGDDPSPDPMELCQLVLEHLGLAAMVANPLIAKSFQANLRVRDRQDLLRD